MAVAHPPQLSKHATARAFIEGIFGGRDWSLLHPLIRDGIQRQVFGASTVTQFLELCVNDEAVRRELRRAIVSERSWKRRMAERAPLSASEIERMVNVAEVVREVRRLYGGDSEAAEAFLTRPHRRFRGQAPILVAATEGGAQAVRELLGRMEEGAPV